MILSTRGRRALIATAALTASCASPSNAPEAGGVLAAAGEAVDDIAAVETRGERVAASPSGAYLAGAFAEDAGDRARAAVLFGEALAADPDDAELAARVFRLSVEIGAFERAVELARELESGDDVALTLAIDDALAGRFEQALARMRAAPRDGLGVVVAPLIEGWAAFGAGDFDGVRQALAPADPSDGARALLDYHFAGALALDGRIDEARETLAPHLSGAPDRLLRRAARLAALAGDFDAARELLGGPDAADDPSLERDRLALSRGEAIDAEVVDAISGMADALIGVAAALRQQNAVGRGVFYARLASWLDPEAGEAWLVLGELHMAEGAAAEAAEALARTPPSSRFAWSSRVLRGDALAELERYAEAEATFAELAAEREDRVDPMIALGDMMRRREMYEEAAEAYGEAIERLGERIEERHWRLFYARGIAFERTDRWPSAERDFERALELRPDHPLVLNYLGYSWVDQGVNLERAEEMLRRAVALRPEDGFIVDSLGWAFYRLGDFAAATEQLERAVALEPGDPVINDHLGDAYWRVGREREARFQWERALALDPEPEDRAEIRRKLREGLDDEREARGGRG